MPVGDLDEKIAIDQAFVGSCANGKLEDFRIAAQVVRGRKVASGVRFIVTPASQKVLLEAVRRGYVESLLRGGRCCDQFDLWRLLRRAHGSDRR